MDRLQTVRSQPPQGVSGTRIVALVAFAKLSALKWRQQRFETKSVKPDTARVTRAHPGQALCF